MKGKRHVIKYIKKTWSQSCARFHDVKVFALPCPSKPSNAENPTRMYMINTVAKYGYMYTSTPQGAFSLLCFRRTVRGCEVLTSSKPKRL